MNAPGNAAAGSPIGSTALAQKFLNVVLFITVLASCFVFIEPSPHDGLIFVLLAMCVAARVPFDRKLIPLLLLLLMWVAGAALSLIQVGDQEKPIQYVGTSLYLSIAALMFACLFSGGDLVRLAIMRRGYILAALFATATGYIGFFHLLPGSDIFTSDGGRVSATFKDPNVYGPFLIFPITLLMVEIMTRGAKLSNLAIMGFLSSGLLLSFSRGAWGHFALSACVCFVLLVAIAPSHRLRARIVLLGVAAVVMALLIVIALLSIDSVHDMFVERAKALQYYDVGPGGRFSMQELGPSVILANPFGIGPFEFDRIYGLSTHNSYLQSFIVYGWIGGAAYIALVAITLLVGVGAVIMPTPWQPYLVAAYAAFVGEAGEALIVDTEHWRHFFLLLGLIWGLTVANINLRRRRVWLPRADDNATMLPENLQPQTS